jgi:hypothetical protein
MAMRAGDRKNLLKTVRGSVDPGPEKKINSEAHPNPFCWLYGPLWKGPLEAAA